MEKSDAVPNMIADVYIIWPKLKVPTSRPTKEPVDTFAFDRYYSCSCSRL